MKRQILYTLLLSFVTIYANAQWSSSGSDIYFNTGNVGVGTNSPSYSLDVNGDLNLSGGNFIRMGGSPVLSNPGAANAFIATTSEHGSSTGIANTFIGFKAGENNSSGAYNAFIGYRAGSANMQGGFNAFIGAFAGQNNITGKYNSFIGYRAGDANTYGEYNNYIGLKAGFSSTTGNYNSAIGYEAGYSSTNGDKNVFLGYQTGYDNTTGYNNTYIGSEADGSPGIYNATAIGFGATVSSNNSVVLGDANAKVGIGTSSPGQKLHVEGGSASAIYASSSGTTYDRTIEAVNSNGSVIAIGAGQTLSGYVSTPSGIEIQAATGHQGVFSSTADESAIVGQTDDGGDAIEGWVFSGSGRSGYFHGGSGVLVDDGLETDDLKVTNGANDGYLLQSDASGNASWVDPTAIDDDWKVSGNDIYTDTINQVGIGGTASARFHIWASGTAISDGLKMTSHENTSSDWYMYMPSGDHLTFRDDATDVMTFEDGSGNVGIGTNSPGAKLDVNGTTETDQLNTGTIKSTGDIEVTIDENDNNSLTAFFEIFNGAGNHAFYVTENGNARIYNDGFVDGSLGVGTISPSHALHVDAPSGQSVIRLQQDGDTQFNIGSSGGVNIGSSAEYAPTDGLYVNNELLVNTTTAATGYMVSVNGKIMCEEVKVQLSGDWPDYVFSKDYQLKPLNELEADIQSNGHLPNIPSAAEVEKDGITLGEMQKKMMEKIEELTLYTIQQQKEIEALKEQNEELIKELKK